MLFILIYRRGLYYENSGLKGHARPSAHEQTLRDYIQGKILETYRASGFERISTPMLEDMENLDKSDGGDNLNLIFKVLKRGDKLTAALNSGDPKSSPTWACAMI